MCLRCRFTGRSRSCAGSVVSQQTMSNWVLTAGERWLLPVYHALHKELLENKILHADETTLMVLREPERQALADELGTAFGSLHSGMPRHTRAAMTARSWMRTSRRSARMPTRAWTGCRKSKDADHTKSRQDRAGRAAGGRRKRRDQRPAGKVQYGRIWVEWAKDL